ncbi:MAG: dipicolinate synthase subunit B [Clostridia bacterium]
MKIGIAFCGSFCTTSEVIEICEKLILDGYQITPILSEHVNSIDTRFGKSDDIVKKITQICKNKPILDIVSAERIGPEKMFDALVIAPCTGNTLAKLAQGITDNTVTMSAKSHLRNERPLIIALASNDALSAGAVNLGTLLNRKHYYFVPLGQDNPFEKPNSLVCDMNLISKTIEQAVLKKQIQPILSTFVK